MQHTATTEIELPVRTVYDQWTQFEDFPLFMDHVMSVEQIDDTHLHWKAKISGISREWKAEITEQSPDQRIAWKSVDGTSHAGVVTFHPLSDDQTKVVLQIDIDPEGFVEKVADWGGYVSDRTDKDLAAFKEFVEARGAATGSWRGEVDRPANRQETILRRELSELSKDELVDRASKKHIDNRSNMSRDELIDAIAG